MRIFAANLSSNVSVTDIRRVFEVFGRVRDVLLVGKRSTNLSGGVAFLEMPDFSEGSSAIFGTNCFVLKGRTMVVGRVRTGPVV
jgi:RNA recognition motif-containing protein